MSDAVAPQDSIITMDYTAVAAVTGGQIVQLSDGRAGVVPTGRDAGDLASTSVSGIWTVTKAANLVWVDGCEVYWDHSANAAVLHPASDKDFFLGTAVGDVAAATTTGRVNINVSPAYKIDISRGGISDATVSAIILTAGTVGAGRIGGSDRFSFSATAEAQKADILSKQGFAVGANWIVEGGFTVVDDGDDVAIDFNVGLANATHATDADSITESCFLHLDGNSLDLYAESDDGTTEVNATDTTVNIALGTPVHFVMDGRNEADIQIYVNGVLVLGSTVFKLDAAAGPMKLLAHLEKTSNDTPAEYYIDYLRVRIANE